MKAIRIVQSLTLAGLAVAGLVTTSAAALAEGATESPAPTLPITCTPDGVPAPTLPTAGIPAGDPAGEPGVPAGDPIDCVPAGEPGVPPLPAA
ncbi:hypothetical protein AB0I53_31835 [Saccharopolyspora sp. NPDC050389]|uniref:hypothetical protein n=1 Tax=Saccharopolyspora sp. NPDC050389 TaxID=3155516 RepID=UPI0033FF98F3